MAPEKPSLSQPRHRQEQKISETMTELLLEPHDIRFIAQFSKKNTAPKKTISVSCLRQ